MCKRQQNFFSISFCAALRSVLAMLLLLLSGVGSLPHTGHAEQGKPGETLIQTFTSLYGDKNPANRVAAMLLSVGMVDHAELVAALRKRLPTAPQGERELVLYTMAALSYDPLTRTSTNPADIDAWLDAFPRDYATYRIFSGAENVLAGGVWNMQVTDFLDMLACDPGYRNKARTALAQDSVFRMAIPDSVGRPRDGNMEIYRACLNEEYTPTRAITPAPANPGRPFIWGEVTAVGKRLAKLLDSQDAATRTATLLVLRNIDSSIYMNKLEQRRKEVQDPQERVFIDIIYDFSEDYTGKKSEAQLCSDFPKTAEGIAGIIELENKIYTRHYLYLLSNQYYPGVLRCLDENGVPLSFHILQAGKKYMSNEEYQHHLNTIARTAISGSGQGDESKRSYRRALRLGPPEFREYCARYVEQEIQRVKGETFANVAEENRAYVKARCEAYVREMHEALEEISGNAIDE